MMSKTMLHYKNMFLENIQAAPFLYKLLISLVTGITLSFIQAPTNLWFLLFPCLSIFFIFFAQAQNKTQAFFTTYVFSLGYFVAGLYWIGNALLVEGNDYAWAWPLAVLALPALLAVFSGFFLTLSYVFFKQQAILFKFLGFCIFLGLSEWVRGYVFTGFPWGLYAYTWVSILPVAQTVSYVGSYGLSFLTILWGCVFGYLFIAPLTKRNLAVASIIFTTFLISLGWGIYTLKESPTLFNQQIAVQIIQPNIPQVAKWDSSQLVNNFETLTRLSSLKTDRNGGIKTIIVWPETALPASFVNNVAVNERIYSFLGLNDILLSGALNTAENEQTGLRDYYNALLLWSPEVRAKQIYAKSHLVPFGEYIPFQNFIPLQTVTNFSGFAKGNGAQTIAFNNFPAMTPLICYESIFPALAHGSIGFKPAYILIITNDAWYGDSPGPYQHFVKAQFRAIENATPVVRSANTGLSGVIDAHGRVISMIDLNEQGVVHSPLPMAQSDLTFYAKFKDFPFLVFAFLVMGLLIINIKIQP